MCAEKIREQHIDTNGKILLFDFGYQSNQWVFVPQLQWNACPRAENPVFDFVEIYLDEVQWIYKPCLGNQGYLLDENFLRNTALGFFLSTFRESDQQRGLIWGVGSYINFIGFFLWVMKQFRKRIALPNYPGFWSHASWFHAFLHQTTSIQTRLIWISTTNLMNHHKCH